MPKKELDITLIIGIVVNILAIAFFAYVYWVSIPRKSDLKVFPAVIVPNIESDILENELGNLEKAEGIPIEIEAGELGKENPYF